MFVREVPARSGTPAGTIVYIHGLGESGLCFEGLMLHPRLGRWHQLAADVPGYGRSPGEKAPLSLAEQADRLADWIRSRASRPVALVGHSMGGVSGLLLCERHPDVVDRFVNVEGNMTIEDCTFSGKAAADPLEAFLARGFARLLEQVYRAGITDEAHRRYFASMRHGDPRQYHRNSGELVEVAASETPAARLAALPMPVTYIAGVPRGAGERSRGIAARAGLDTVVIEDAGHWPFLDHPDAFAGVLADRLEAKAAAEEKP